MQEAIIRNLAAGDAELCARMMTGSEPWLTIGRSFEHCLKLITDPTREVYVVDDGGTVRGFIIINMNAGPLRGYIQTICVDAAARSGGFGSRLIAFAEARIFRDAPNVFLCVSSFNPRARALYERLGYETIGEMRDLLIKGQSEILMRKTTGPILG